jgi:hypothetical protein
MIYRVGRSKFHGHRISIYLFRGFLNLFLKFLIHLLGITKLDKEKNQRIKERTGAENIVKEIKQYQEK